MATVDPGEDSPRDVGVGDTPQEAVAAPEALGEPHASEMAAGVDFDQVPA